MAIKEKGSSPLTFDLRRELLDQVNTYKRKAGLRSTSAVIREAVGLFDYGEFRKEVHPHQQISVRLPVGQKEKLLKLARQKKVSVGELLRVALVALPDSPIPSAAKENKTVGNSSLNGKPKATAKSKSTQAPVKSVTKTIAPKKTVTKTIAPKKAVTKTAAPKKTVIKTAASKKVAVQKVVASKSAVPTAKTTAPSGKAATATKKSASVAKAAPKAKNASAAQKAPAKKVIAKAPAPKAVAKKAAAPKATPKSASSTKKAAAKK